MRRFKIGYRLSFSFGVIFLLMLLGSAIAIWQLNVLYSQAQSLFLVDQQATAVLRVYNDVLTLKDKLRQLAATHDEALFLSEAHSLRDAINADVARASQAFSVDADKNATTLSILESIASSLPAQADLMVNLARAGDWEAVNLRLDNQVQSISLITRGLAEDIASEVTQKQSQALENMRRAQQQAFVTLGATGLLMLLTAIFLGYAVTRSIVEPLKRLDTAAKALARGDFQHTIQVTGIDELAELSRAFKYASAQLEMFYQELQRSETHFRLLIENASDIITIHTSDGLIIYESPSSERVLGYKPEEMLGKNAFDFIHPEDQQKVREAFQKVTEQLGTTTAIEFRFRHKGGEWRFIEAIGRSLSDGSILTGIVVNSRDITRRKLLESERTAIAAIASALRTAQTRAEMLPIILDQAMNLLKASGAALAMNNMARGETILESGCGEWVDWAGVPLPQGRGISAFVIGSGQSYLNNDAPNDPRAVNPELYKGLKAAACVPLSTREQIIGALWVGRSNDIIDSEVHLLAAIADIAANAILRATLYEQTEERLRRLDALRTIDMSITASMDLRIMLHVILEQTISQLNVDAACILLFRSFDQSLEYAASRGFRTPALKHTYLRLGESYAGQAALHRRRIAVPNLLKTPDGLSRASLLYAEGFVSYFCVPLIAKGQIKGVLEIFNRSEIDPESEWMEFLEALAGQAAIAIENATLLDDIQSAHTELMLAYDATIEGWSRALELRDKETEGHTLRVTHLTVELARAMGISNAQLVHIRRGALLHDIGKIGIPDNILLKPGPLTDEERAMMRRHSEYAYNMLSPISYLRLAMDIPYCHHEKWDGTGYPRQLKGDAIPLAARIFTVIDVWDALTSDRPYRPAWQREKVIEYIREGTGKHFDPKVVEAFLKMIAEEAG